MNFTFYKTVFQFHFCYFIQASSNRLAKVQRKRVETERLVESSSLYNLSTVFSETDYKNIDHVMENIKKNYSGVVKFRSLVSKDLWQKAKKARLRMDRKMVDELFTPDVKENNTGVVIMESGRSVTQRVMSPREVEIRSIFDTDDEDEEGDDYEEEREESEQGDDVDGEEKDENDEDENEEGDDDEDIDTYVQEVIYTNIEVEESGKISTVFEKKMSYEDKDSLQLREHVKNVIMEVFKSELV